MPDINDLPTELMVETFSHLELDDLTRCMRSSKTFRAITEHSAFDKIFFRTTLPSLEDTLDLDKLQINPAFRSLSYICRSKIEDTGFLFVDEKPGGSPNYRTVPLTETSAATQNATEPAVTSLTLRPYDMEYDVEIEVEDGVTVLDVMKGLCGYYDGGVPYDSCHYFFEGFYRNKWSTGEHIIFSAHWGS
ncbi:hypothetical protein D6D19_10717 [Aureobasidium pullulans]|uniref:F-box domain-containing protein n=1 Tax=Aureobasidium pullulans TaxID=5580 RepID=A0A4S8YPZ6_AURPU|nr:hypothetical protein D6D19_10717 [Aureobasidium pullulans]THY14293.1 hypothetical protein D6D00_09853 [Aureobasidium pullulans]